MKISKRLLSYCLPYAGILSFAFILIVLTTVAINFLPVIIQKITDQCLITQNPNIDERLNLLVKLSILYISIAGLGHLIKYLQGLLTAYIGQKIIFDLRLKVFKKVLNLHQGFFDKTPVGTLMTRVTSDIERLQNFVTDGALGTIADLVMLIGIMSYMIYISPQLAITIFICLPILFIFMVFVNKRLLNANRNIRDRQANLNAFLQENLSGMSTVQSFNKEDLIKKDFEKRHLKLRSAYYDEVRWFSLYFPTVEAGQAISTALTLFIGGIMIINGSSAVTLGTLVAFFAWIREFFRPLGSLSEKAGSFQVAIASIERVFNLLDYEEKIKNIQNPIIPSKLKGHIKFQNVWFAYDEDNWVIKNLSFEVKPGESLAIVGATGAGKSTIINLIGRFYDIQKGNIEIDGINIKNFEKNDLRKRLGYVFQDPFIFSGTVFSNISLNNKDLTKSDIENAAKIVNAHPFITKMKNGYSTNLSERGEGLSLGQKQLLVMTRTLAQSPELLFVLDEATASVDTVSEKLIQNALKKLMENKTSIVIAHRLSTIRNANRILVMRNGELIDQGSHNELVGRDGYYKNLCEIMEINFN
jgi:ATP-binding cassette subfamily B protein